MLSGFPLTPSLLLVLAACGGGGGGGGVITTFSGLPDEITLYEGQNRFPAFTTTEDILPYTSDGGVRIDFDPVATEHEETIVTVRGAQIFYPSHSHTWTNIKGTATVLETGQTYQFVIPTLTARSTATDIIEIDTDRNVLVIKDAASMFSTCTLRLIDSQGSLVGTTTVPGEAVPADGSVTEITFKKITLVFGDQSATGEVLITAADGEANETGELLVADITGIVDNNDLFPDFRFQWVREGTDINGETQQTFTPQTAGTYQVKVTVIDDQYLGATSTELISAEVEII